MSPPGRSVWFGIAVAALMVLSSLGLLGGAGLGSSASPVSPSAPALSAGTANVAAPFGAAAAGSTHAGPVPPASMTAFRQRVAATAHALSADGVPADQIRLPYVGAESQILNGVVVPGVELSAETARADSASLAAPSGLAYYGENESNGVVQATTLNASSVAGTVTVNQLNALYLDVDTPDLWGIQLNAEQTNVSLDGTGGYQFWVQNTVDYIEHNDTLNFGEDTWNFSTPSSYLAPGNATILSHNPNGSIFGGLYIGLGPYIYAPRPFTLTLYLNSSVTPAGEQEVWFNYTLLTPGNHRTSANYDWIVFNSTGSDSSYRAPLAPFEASGGQINPVGQTYDYELDYGIGAFNGATMDVLAANVSARLDYCPAATPSCASDQFQSVPAAEDFGSETGETGSGQTFTYSGTNETATAGPFLLRPLWGYSGAAGATAGSTPVRNQIAVSGAPVASSTVPYVFLFLANFATPDPGYAWAPDAPTWDLAPGTYSYQAMLADYAEQTGTLVVGTAPVVFSVTLPYQPASGVYTPLWAFNNSALAGISTSGDGSIADQYELFDTPTVSCIDCGNASNGSLSNFFGGWNDWDYPTFVGLLLDGTDAYATLDRSVTFSVDPDFSATGFSIYLQIALVSSEHVTLAHDALAGGYPFFSEEATLAGTVSAAVNPFPTGNVVLWNSSEDLIASNTFVGSDLGGSVCSAPAELLLYGGTGNTVWNNTFEDNPGPYGGAAPCYAGLAEAESGDLIYNNNFSVDNPTVYLPFDVYYDACPTGYAGQCGPMGLANYADRWNVSLQPASGVSATVNGYALSGDVLGGSCALQGGNYWSDYGNALNLFPTLPFVDRYNYSDVLIAYPEGSTAIQDSIPHGGDYLPLTRASCSTGPVYAVHFVEHGLPVATTWSLGLDGQSFTSPTAWINFSLPNGTYPYALGNVAGYSATLTGIVSVAGAKVRVGVTFSPVRYVVEFEERGLGNGPRWNVTIDGLTLSTTSTNQTRVKLVNGTYSYTIPNVPDYSSPTSGTLTVAGHSITVRIHYSLVKYRVVFDETGLPAHTPWSVTVGTLTVGSTHRSLSLYLPNGTYTYSVSAAGSGFVAVGGSFGETGGALTVTVTFVAGGSVHPAVIAAARRGELS